MRKLRILFLISLFVKTSTGQVAINNDGSAPDATSMLHVKIPAGIGKGFLMPTLTTALRTGIVAPADGLQVYDTQTKSIWFYRGGIGWVEITMFNLPYYLSINQAHDFPNAPFEIVNNNTSSGGVGAFHIASASNSGNALIATTIGTGTAFRAEASANNATAIFGRTTQTNTGYAGYFSNDNSSNGSPTVLITSNTTNLFSWPLTVSNTGSGHAANFTGGNPSLGSTVVQILSNGTYFSRGLSSVHNGLGIAGYFENGNITNGNSVQYVLQSGLGQALTVYTQNISNAQDAVNVVTDGTGDAIDASSTSGTAVKASSTSGTAINALSSSSIGSAGVFAKSTPYGGVYTNLPIADFEVRHPLIGSLGLTGLRIFNTAGGNTSWTFYANNTGNLSLYYKNTAMGAFSFSTGAYTASSDSRVKTDIAEMSTVLSNVMKLNAKSYTYKFDETHKRIFGFIAQDVEPLFPELIYKTGVDKMEGYYRMDYSGFGVIAIKAVQELQQIIAGQQKEIDELRSEIADIKTLLKR